MIGDLGDLCLNSSNSTINNEQKLGSNNTTHNLNGRHRRQDSTNSSKLLVKLLIKQINLIY